MTKVLFALLLLVSLCVPASAAEMTAPEVPSMGQEQMPQNTDSFGDGFRELIQNSLSHLHPEFESAVQTVSAILLAAMLFSILSGFSERTGTILSVSGTAAIGALMLQNTTAMIGYASETVQEICEYGKLLCPVMTMALAAQGGITASAGLYAGTMVFLSVMSMAVSRVLVPLVYVFLLFSVSGCALGNEMMKKFSGAVKSLLSWLLKILMIVFTAYMSITGAVSGTTDAAALKAAKITISSFVPVVGGILSDASESVLVSIGVMKNTAGTYGILAVLAVFAGPFIKVGLQYLLLKASAGICGIFCEKNFSALIDDFSSGMGLLLAMVSAACMLVLFSTVCFMKGIG